MKRLFLILGILLMFTSCEWLFGEVLGEDLNSYRDWAVWNNTGQTLKLKTPYFYNEENVENKILEIKDGSFVRICRYNLSDDQSKVNFDDYFTKCAYLYGEDVNWQILS